jgi:G3E family GTPase
VRFLQGSSSGTERYDEQKTPSGSRWQVELNQSSFLLSKNAGPLSSELRPLRQGNQGRGNSNPKIDYGFQSMVYHARQPFHSKRFMEQARTGFPNVLRAKGFYWLDEQPERVGFLSIAGSILRADTMGPWWIARLQSGAISWDEIPEPVQALWWNDKVGDRRQELVLIGIDLDEPKIRKILDDCLV